MACLSLHQWEKLILRWTPLELTPEVNLLARVVASALAGSQVPGSDDYDLDLEFVHGEALENYCSALHLSPRFVREQRTRADVFDMVDA